MIVPADAVIICVPTPVDDAHVPDLAALRGACADVVATARPGQTDHPDLDHLRRHDAELLTEPLAARGLTVGRDVFVAFSPERIDPGNPDHRARETPRVVGGVTTECAQRAAAVVSMLTDEVYVVSSPEAAEATKLYENIFRAVSLALANEFADACGALRLDPIEVTLAAGPSRTDSSPPSPGRASGGHCIPCDPYYLLWQLGRPGPLLTADRAGHALDRAAARAGSSSARARARGRWQAADRRRVIVVGAAYKPGVRGPPRSRRRSRSRPAWPRKGADVRFYDPLVPSVTLPDRQVLSSETSPGTDWDLVIVHTLHPGVDYTWAVPLPGPRRDVPVRRRGRPGRGLRRLVMTTTFAPGSSALAAAGGQPADVSMPAVVLKFDPNVMHHGGLGAIRSLGRMGVPVYAVQESSWSPRTRATCAGRCCGSPPGWLPTGSVPRCGWPS